MNYQKKDISLIEKGQATPKENRIYYLDNLRTFMIFLLGSLCYKLRAKLKAQEIFRLLAKRWAFFGLYEKIYNRIS